MDRAASDLERCAAGLGRPIRIDWRDELALRARALARWPRGAVSANGSCRILRAADDWVALTVARPWDRSVLPALVEGPVARDEWETVRRWIATRSADEAVERARLLDMAAARLGSLPEDTPVPLRASRRWPAATPRLPERSHRDEPGRALNGLGVIDLSALWAGPLAARLLSQCGASVTKVEAVARPDGARQTPELYRLLHPSGQSSVVVDLATERGRAELHDLVEGADVVIEASRPRALEQLGCGPEEVGSRDGRIWLSITGYGRRGAGSHWIAFGDDAAVAGGLTTATQAGEPAFCGDAIADPITGILGASAVLRSLAAGGGHLVEVALAGAAAAVAQGDAGLPELSHPPTASCGAGR